MDCPYKYNLTIIEGWRKKDESVHLKFGGVFAYAMEAYAHAKPKGADHEDALDAAVARTLLETWNHERDDTNARIPGTGGPWEPDNSPKKNRDTLLRTVIWYFEEYKDDPAKTLILPNGAPATEVSFKFESGIADPYGGEYLLTGHLDKGVVYGDDPFVMDQKTTGGGLGAVLLLPVRSVEPDEPVHLRRQDRLERPAPWRHHRRGCDPRGQHHLRPVHHHAARSS
jgi:hypothetical protein